MEDKLTQKPKDLNANDPNQSGQINISKEYELNLDQDTYSLKIEVISNETILYYLRQINNISFTYYYNEYNYETLVKELVLPAQHYDNIEKIFKFYDTAIEKKKVVLNYDKEKNQMILLLNITVFFDDIESKLCLEPNQITNEQMIKILFNEIRELKAKKFLQVNEPNKPKEENNNNIINNDAINKLEEKNKQMETKINELINENKKIKEDLNKCLKYIEEKIDEKKKEEDLKQKMKEENEKFIKQNIKAEFKENPQNLKLRDILTTNASSCAYQSKFDVYIGLKDHIEYLVYNNKDTNNLDIMRIRDKTIITSLKGHNANTIVIKYYLKDDKEEYILSSDANKLVIIWDIQNFFNKKYTIQAQYSSNILDAGLLFNVFNKDYILLSNYASNEYSKLYEFKENTPFIKNIYGTNDHITYFMVPWFYQNKYYLIECANNKIYINNMFEDENYANLSMDPEGSYYYCGYLYNGNYLCVSDYNQKFVRIWDLVNKVIYKQINYEGTSNTCSYEIIPWNINYTIFGCDGSFVVMNITDGKTIKKTDVNNGDIRSMKKIKIGQIGECLICVGGSNNNTIQLYSI